MIVLGMMSGTSADGIDAAIVELTGQPPSLSWKLIKHIHAPFSEAIQAEIFACFNPRTSGVDRLCALNFALGGAYARAAGQACHSGAWCPRFRWFSPRASTTTRG